MSCIKSSLRSHSFSWESVWIVISQSDSTENYLQDSSFDMLRLPNIWSDDSVHVLNSRVHEH